MQRCASFRSGLGQREDAGRELERREVIAAAGLGTLRLPMQPTGDHQMNDDEQFVIQLNRDALAESLDGDDALTDQVGEWRLDRAQKKRRFETHFVEWLADNPSPERLDVDGNVGQLRHDDARRRGSSTHYGPLDVGRATFFAAFVSEEQGESPELFRGVASLWSHAYNTHQYFRGDSVAAVDL